MKVLVNDQEVSTTTDHDATLGLVLTEVQDHHIAAGDVIATITIDDEPLTAERLSIWKDRPAADFDEARVDVTPRNILAANGLRAMSESLTASAAQREAIVDATCQGRTSEAMEQLNDYLQVWSRAQQHIASVCRLLQIPVEGIEVSDGQAYVGDIDAALIQQRLGELSEQLQEVKSALEAGDLVLLGDILNYEFGDLTENFSQMLTGLADQCHIDPTAN